MERTDVRVEARGVRKTFAGARRPALDGVDLTVRAGRVLALLGANGAGKTTMIRILTTLLAADAGTARVAGYDVATQGGRVRASIGLAGQYAALDEILTGRQNLEMFSKLAGYSRIRARERSGELLAAAGLVEVADRPVAGLSGGLRRRMDLAASLITTPAVLFVDEPTAGLDPQARRDLWGRLRGMADGGVAILLTTQYLEEADALADDVVILKDGSVIARGTPAELKTLVGEPRWVMQQPTLEDVYLKVVGE
ncbi:ATP-binding cassette domain-containing protein [Kineosporia sp. J2-2]|uniref:ATP-binding cassette domain-containing protein n=1 Tax=Kineosporia corallincola TaxID=2835133 RepID=A0ABS5TMA3_9ACTN|nr:ATP-binding cassette domain-containing protein [Kineosporia corallincola]MBT0772234.1 ATP-binding cassette domain-containing protein [Kineosporia corallincola]